MSLRDLRKKILEKNMLSKFFFAEDVTVCSAGPDRVVTVKIRDTTLVEEGEGMRRIEVLCMRDESNTEVGGIANPAVGDVIIRQDGSRYGYTGEIVYACELTHKLVYSSNYPHFKEASPS